MIELYAKPSEELSELFTAEGLLDEQTLESFSVRSTADIRSLLDDPNRVTLSRPECIDVVELSTKHRLQLSPFIASQVPQYDFWVVRWACTFRPSPSCEFVRASVAIELSQSRSAIKGNAVAYDMFPRSVDIPITVKRTYSVSPEIQFKFTESIEGKVTLGSAERSSEYTVYEPEITAFGFRESSAGWDFDRTRARPVRGIKELYLLVKKPKGDPLWGRFKLSASVQTNVGRVPLSTFFLSGGRKPVIDEHYSIKP